ncbi:MULTISPECIES: hypothetical protein [Sphingobium]|uniref:Uncharacterized protein n=1 Tax=Sphingobium yanoikuyae TaxID=13690 RepID=A0A9X7UFE5_SPHYA|nr:MULTISPECIES: hypothetical protein [Sphingobium]MDV3482480.1 hypothetical protein [Sphingobium yanoikuyae]QNG49336.1 hypothetical protein H3V42_13305 [Sphingobium yanoikuyae]
MVEQRGAFVSIDIAKLRNCDEAELAEVDRAFLWRRQFLNEYAFEGYVDGVPGGL